MHGKNISHIEAIKDRLYIARKTGNANVVAEVTRDLMRSNRIVVLCVHDDGTPDLDDRCDQPPDDIRCALTLAIAACFLGSSNGSSLHAQVDNNTARIDLYFHVIVNVKDLILAAYC